METVKLKVRAGTSRVGSEVSEVIIVELEDGLSSDDRELALNKAAWDWVLENIDYGYSEVPYYED